MCIRDRGSEEISDEIKNYIADKEIEFLGYEEDFDKNVEAIESFYKKIDQ